jgi:hypothetical protein
LWPILFCKDFPKQSSDIGGGSPVDGGMAGVGWKLRLRCQAMEQTASLQTALLRND